MIPDTSTRKPAVSRFTAALQALFQILVSGGIVASGVWVLFTGWSDRRALERERATKVDDLARVVLARDGLLDKVLLLEKQLVAVQASANTEYTSRSEADTQHSKAIAEIKTKLESK